MTFYKKTIISRPATLLTIKARKKILNIFFQLYPDTQSNKIIDLGVTSDPDPSANFLEQVYPNPSNITCVGIQDFKEIESMYPGVKFIKINPGEALPFKNKQFDILYSNAVIEHVGTRDMQKLFISECLRVSKYCFITTPNRWFPVEMHTHLPLLHYLPQPIFRFILKLLGDKFYSDVNNLNLLTLREFKGLFPDSIPMKYKFIKTFGINSNIIIYTDTEDK